MNLLDAGEVELNVNLPKYTEDTLVIRNNYFVVTNGVVFNSYPIKVFPSEESSPLIRLDKNPPVLLEGYAIIGRKLYLVPMQDLLRKVIRKSREIKKETTNEPGNTEPKSLSTIARAFKSSIVPSDDEQRTNDAADLEISKAADATWEDQIGTLHDNPFEEEEDWEVQDDS